MANTSVLLASTLNPMEVKGVIVADRQFNRTKLKSPLWLALRALLCERIGEGGSIGGKRTPSVSWVKRGIAQEEDKKWMLELVRVDIHNLMRRYVGEPNAKFPQLNKLRKLYSSMLEEYEKFCARLQATYDALPVGNDKDSKKAFSHAIKDTNVADRKVLFGVKGKVWAKGNVRTYFAHLEKRTVTEQLHFYFFPEKK